MNTKNNIEIKKFKNKSGLFNYLKDKFKDSNLILIKGSTAYGRVKCFSDFDVEVYVKKIKKPYYEIFFIKEMPVLLSVYFYKYTYGNKIKPPKGIKIVKGNFNNNLKREHIPMYGEGHYNTKERIKRDCQLVTDFCFKYFRSKDKQYLKYIQKRIR